MSKSLKKTVLTAAVSTALIAGGLVTTKAHAELSFNVGVTSNYMFRGLTESNDDAAVQGGVDFEHDSGFYVGAWTSSLGGAQDGEESLGYELDIYFGFAGEITDTGVGFDVGYNAYIYPQQSKTTVGEIYGALDYMGFYGMVSYVTNSQDGGFLPKKSLAYEAGYEFEAMPDLSLGGTVGYVYNKEDSDARYTWWSLHATKSMDFGDITMAYVGNDLDDKKDPKLVISYGLTF